MMQKLSNTQIWRKVFIIHTDASEIAAGATLSQEDQKGKLKSLASGSRKLNDAEKNTDHTSKNALPS